MKKPLQILLISLFLHVAGPAGFVALPGMPGLSGVQTLFVSTLHAQTFPVEVIQYMGSPDEFLNLVILGDGYTLSEQEKLAEDARRTAAEFLAGEPFASLKDRINVFAVRVVSNQSGAAMHPSGMIDNYFGSSYWSYNIERLLVAWHTDRIYSVLHENTPFYDTGVVMVNHPKYGGSGGEFAVFSTHEWAGEIMLHELGHSLAGLSDEYWAGPEYARENTNMTQDSNPTTNRWRDFLNQNGIGIYPHMEAPQWFRPHQNCKMRHLGAPFCDVCSHKITSDVESLSGDPLPDAPIAFFSSSDVQVEAGGSVTFYDLSSYRPESWSWTFEGGDPEESNVQNPAVTYETPGQYSVRLQVSNEHGDSDLIRDGYIVVSAPVNVPVVPAAGIRLDLYPNPVTDRIHLSYDPPADQSPFRVLTMTGAAVLGGTLDRTIDVSTLPPGVYILQVETPAQTITRRFIKTNPQ